MVSEVDLGCALDSTVTIAIESLASRLMQARTEESTWSPANVPGVSPDGCRSRRKPTAQDVTFSPFGKHPFLKGIFGWAIRHLPAMIRQQLLAFWRPLGLTEFTDPQLMKFHKLMNAWATRYGVAVVPHLVQYLIGWGTMGGHTVSTTFEERLEETKQWIGTSIPRHMMHHYAKLGLPHVIERIRNAPPALQQPLSLEEFACTPSRCVTSKSGGSDAKVAGTRGSRVSAWLKNGPQWVTDTVKAFCSGKLRYEGKEFLKLEEEKVRSLIMSVLEAGMVEFFFYQDLETYAERALESMLGVNSADVWLEMMDHVAQCQRKDNIAASIDISNWDDIPDEEMSRPLLEAYLERCAEQNPDKDQDWYREGQKIMAGWIWGGHTRVQVGDRIEYVEHKAGNTSGTRVCAVLNSSLLEALDIGVEKEASANRVFKQGLGDDLAKIMAVAHVLTWISLMVGAALGHPEKGLASQHAMELLKFWITKNGRVGYYARAIGAVHFSAPWAGGIPGPHSLCYN